MRDSSAPAPDAAGPRRFTRREGLLALAVVAPAGLLAACTSGGETAPEPSGTPEPEGLAEAISRQELELVARYDAAIAAFPELAQPLTAIRDQHLAHADALVPGSAPDPASIAPAVTSARATVRSLIADERSASRDRIRSCVDSPQPELARTLAFIAASEASHVPALKDLDA